MMRKFETTEVFRLYRARGRTVFKRGPGDGYRAGELSRAPKIQFKEP